MKNLLSTLVLASLVVAPASFANKNTNTNAKIESSASTAEKKQLSQMRIGVLDVRSIIDGSDEVKTLQEALQKEFKPKFEEVQALDKGFRENVEKFQRNKDVMSEKERAKLEKEIQSSQQQLMTLQNQYAQESSEKQQQLMQKFLDKVKKEVEVYAKKEKYDLVLISDAVPFMDDKVDITPHIAKALKNKA
jgi:outer membrane protein